MKIQKVQPSKIGHNRNYSFGIKKAVAFSVSSIVLTKEAAAHAAPFFHMHDSNGKTIGMAAGVLLFVGSLVAAGIALYKRNSGKIEDSKEKLEKK